MSVLDAGNGCSSLVFYDGYFINLFQSGMANGVVGIGRNN